MASLAEYYLLRLTRPAARLLHASDPTRLRARTLAASSPVGPAALVCVYRARHLELVERLVAEARTLRMNIALWALDEPAPSLASLTVGSGPGQRLALLNRLCAIALTPEVEHLVVSDDDIRFERGDLTTLLAAVQLCGLGLAQPAHAPGSYASHRITRARPLTLARLTTFVEIGPLLVIGRPWFSRVLPFPEAFGMGWGLEFLWYDLWKEGCPLGIIDAVSVCHVSPGGVAYDRGSEGERIQAMLSSRKLTSFRAIQRSLRAWRLWQKTPPWRSPAGA